jgi:WD40 repeat protein
VADLDGDGRREAVFGSNKGNLHAISADGQDIAGFPVRLDDRIISSPAIGDIDGDSSPDVVVGCDNGMLYAFDSRGSMLPGFPCRTASAIKSSPAIGDIDGDGEPEVAVGSNDGGIYAWHGNGSTVCGFPVITGGLVSSSPALYDINLDGRSDIVIGVYYVCQGIDECFEQYSYGSEGAKIFALDGSGMYLEGFPKSLLETDIMGFSSPVLADFDGKGDIEIMAAASSHLYAKSTDASGGDLRGFPRKVDGRIGDSFIAVGDLEGDGSLEVVAGSTDGRIYAWRSDGKIHSGFPIQTGGYVMHVTLGDIDGDGQQEIFGGSTDNRVHAWRLNGSEVEGFPKVTLGDIEAVPTLSDIDNDGRLDLLAGSEDGKLYAWPLSDSFGKLAWPMICQNLQHTGVAAV